MGLGPMGGGPGGSGFGLRHHHHHDDNQDEERLKITDVRMLKWFYRNLAPHAPKIVLALVAMIVGTVAGLYIPIVMKHIFDDVIVPRNIDRLLTLTLLFLSLTVISLLFDAVRRVTMGLLGQRFVYTLRLQCYQHLMKLGFDYFERQRSGDVMSRISNDVSAVEEMVVHGTDEIFSNAFYIAGVIGFLFYLDWRLALIALAPLPFFIVGLWFIARYVRPFFNKIRRELGEINARLQERIAGIQVVKAFAREAAEADHFDESNRRYWRLNVRTIWVSNAFFPGLSLITSVGIVLLIWFGGKEAALGASTVTAGTMVAFLTYMQRFYRPIGSLARVQHMLNRSLASIARVFELLDEKPSVKDKEGAIELDHITGKVDIEHVSFKYPTGELVLNDVSVSAEPGETVAIVGRSGAGKTSLVNLIARFYDPLSGNIFVDGHDVRDVTQHSLRSHIAMVLQETFLFNASVRANILYARPKATEEEVIEAAQGAFAHEFITRLPRGYDTVIGERGVRLSGGEKQRIAIARALLADPRILILDEATSMVDTEAEQIIQRALEHLMKGRTTFIIAHRLSTVRNADKIVVIEGGEIIEQDRHEELMRRGGLYREMVARQYDLGDEWLGADTFGPGLV